MTTTTIYDLSATSNHGEEIDFDQFRGRPMLIVNTASKCGFTPQYDGLQKLHETYADQGLVVIGFPCDQFAHQEPGDDSAIEEFCRINFGVTFPLTTKVDVNGSDTHPVFAFLKERSKGLLGSPATRRRPSRRRWSTTSRPS
jgi:glutathione peroxidase